MKKYYAIDAEMVIGARFYLGVETVTLCPIEGITVNPARVTRRALGALGVYSPQYIGRRCYRSKCGVYSIEDTEQYQRRSGMDIEQQKAHGLRQIAAACVKYAGQKSIWGLTIRPKSLPICVD